MRALIYLRRDGAIHLILIQGVTFTWIYLSDFHQHINKPTPDNTLPDLSFSTTKDPLNHVNVGLFFSSRDHWIIMFSINIKTGKTKAVRKRYRITREGEFYHIPISYKCHWLEWIINSGIIINLENFTTTLNNAINVTVLTDVSNTNVTVSNR